MEFMEGIKRFVTFVVENWTMLCAILVLIIAAYESVQRFLAMSEEEQEAEIQEQIEIAKQQVREIMLKLVTEAEKDYREWIKAGAIKRAQVIDEVFDRYPILMMVVNQEELIEWMDQTIDEALKKMRKIFEDNQNLEVAGRYAKTQVQACETVED